MCYMVAKDFHKPGCIAWKTEHGDEIVKLQHELLDQIESDRIQLLTISRPSAFGEYEPYTIVGDEESFKNAVLAM